MGRLPIAIGVSALIAVTSGSAGFIMNSEPRSLSAYFMVSIGLICIALGGLAGLLLVHARWSRLVLGAVVVTSTLISSIGGGAFFYLTLVFGAVAITGLTGPWLTIWVRREPAAEKLGPIPVTLIASGAISPVFVGLGATQGVTAIHWLLVSVFAISAWTYGRGIPPGLWGFRILTPLVGVATIYNTPFLGALIIAAGTSLVVVASWTPLAREVTAVITPVLPAPRPSKDKDTSTRHVDVTVTDTDVKRTDSSTIIGSRTRDSDVRGSGI